MHTSNLPVRHADVARVQLEALLIVAKAAMPGPWDLSNGWIVSKAVSLAASRWPEDADAYEYYGGNLVCESISRADATLVTLARNLMPVLAESYLALLDEIEDARQEIKSLRSRSVAFTLLESRLSQIGVPSIRRRGEYFEVERVYLRRFGLCDSEPDAIRAYNRRESAGV